jgi:hypothetical protein
VRPLTVVPSINASAKPRAQTLIDALFVLMIFSLVCYYE